MDKMDKIAQYKALRKVYNAMRDEIVQENNVQYLVENELTIEAIIKHHATSGRSLKESKEAVQGFEDEMKKVKYKKNNLTLVTK